MPIDREAVRAGSPRRKRLKRSARRVGVVTYIAVSDCCLWLEAICLVDCGLLPGLLGLSLALLLLRLAVLQLPAGAYSVEGVVAVEPILRLEDVEHAAQCRVLLTHLVVVTHKSGVSLVLLALIGREALNVSHTSYFFLLPLFVTEVLSLALTSVISLQRYNLLVVIPKPKGYLFAHKCGIL